MFRLLPFYLLALCFPLLGLVATSAAQGDPAADRKTEVENIYKSLNFQEGKIVLKNGLATIDQTPNFRFLDAKDAQTVLTKIWGNLPDNDVVGMLVPWKSDDKSAENNEDSDWAVVVSYEESGYVKDDEAEKLDYADLLKKMQKGDESANEERRQQGLAELHLIDWAATPHYDKQSHKIYWAMHLQSVHGDSLNYCIRALGRRGILQLNVVGKMDDLPQVEKATPAILSMVNFEQGHSYTDFNASTDKVAAYGIAAVIAGGVLAKAGGLKVLFGILLAAKKFVIIALVAVGSFFKKIFKKVTPPEQRNLE